MSVSLVMTPELSGELQRDAGALEVAQAYLVDSPELAFAANVELKNVKARIARVEEVKAGFVAPAKQIIANAEAFFDPALEALAQAETFLKGQLTHFAGEQQRQIEDAKKKRDEEARVARQKAEQDAAAARAKAEADAREQDRQARVAEEARAKAEAEGRAKDAAKLAAESAKREEEARQTRENGERKAAALELAGAAAATSTVVPEATKLDGFSTRENWKCEFADGFDADKARAWIVAAVAGVTCSEFKRADLLPLLAFDSKASDKLAKALKKSMNVPGLVAVNRPVAASRAG